MEEDLIGIKVWIAERSFPIKIKKEEEEAVRLAIKIANDKIDFLRRNFEGKDDQDFISMALLMYATDQVTEPEKINPIVKDKMDTMKRKIIDTIEE